MATQPILVELIDDPSWNSRLFADDESELAPLATSIAESGLLQPIVVDKLENGRFLLVAGSRRLRAAKSLAWKSIEATVREGGTDERRVVDNVTENVLRKDLSTFELARSFAQMRAQGMKVEEVMRRTGYGKARIGSLINQYQAMPDELKVEWSKRDPVFSAPFLDELHKIKDPDDKIAFYKERKALHAQLVAPSNDNGDEDDEPSKKKPAKKNAHSVSVKLVVYEELRKALVKAEGTKSVAVMVADFLIGKIHAIPGVIEDPLASAEEPFGKTKKGKK